VKLWLSIFLALGVHASLVAQTDKATPKPAEKPAAKAKADAKSSAAAEASQDEQINKVLEGLSPGQVFDRVLIPNYDPATNKLQSLFRAQSAKRIGDRDIEMQGLQIEIHNPDSTTFHVEMAHSVFNFDTKILTSDTPTTIKRNDFVINGDRAQFNVKTRFGRVMGDVKMTIFNTGNVGAKPAKHKKDKPAEAATTATPAATPTPKPSNQ
jgi:hypothetical protein